MISQRRTWTYRLLHIRKYRGRGYATKGLKLTLEKARQRSIHEVYMSVNKDNPASLRVQMKTEHIFIMKMRQNFYKDKSDRSRGRGRAMNF